MLKRICFLCSTSDSTSSDAAVHQSPYLGIRAHDTLDDSVTSAISLKLLDYYFCCVFNCISLQYFLPVGFSLPSFAYSFISLCDTYFV